MITTVTIEGRKSVSKPRGKVHLFAYLVGCVLVFFAVGVGVKSLSDLHGFATVSERIHAFAEQMRMIRPLVLFLVFCFWSNIVSLLSSIRALSDEHAAHLIASRNRFFLWVLVLEVSLGQDLVVIGVLMMPGILIYPKVQQWAQARKQCDG